MPSYPPDTNFWVRVGRFCNIMDDDQNKLSPTKVNTWAATLGAVSAAVGSGLAWFGGHLSGLETVWGASVGWLAQAFTSHHFDKKARYGRDKP